MTNFQLRAGTSVCLASLSFSAVLLSSNGFADSVKPIPVPEKIRVSSSAPRKEIWNRLTEKEKMLAYHLTEAAREGRKILFFQGHRYALTLRKVLIRAFSSNNIAQTKRILGAEGFNELLRFSAKFFDLNAVYENSNRKYYLQKISGPQLQELFDAYMPELLDSVYAEIEALLLDENYEVKQKPDDESGDGLEKTGGNLYQKGITGADVAKAIKDGKLKSDINCRIVKNRKGQIECQIQTVKTPGPVGAVLRKVVRHLKDAVKFASTEHQKNALSFFINYFETGNIEDFRQANMEWVRDRADSKVDFMIGFVEIYDDYLGKIASWESYVQIVDPDTTKLSLNLATNAQYFEDLMPYGKFKKTFPKDYSPPAIMVYYLQELTSGHTSGYNLPNYDDIRISVGAKNVIRLDLPGEGEDASFKAARKEVLTEFMPTAKVDEALASWDKIWRVVVLLHEIIGHGSGTYDETKYPPKSDPISVLGALGSALEEQRADQTALVFGGDTKLVDVGIYKDKDEALKVRNLMYDFYIADFLRRTSRQRSLSEAHQRGHWLLINHLLENGAIEWVSKDGKPSTDNNTKVLAVKDYEKFYQVNVALLQELQRIKATRDEVALKALFETHAPLGAINEPWAQAVIKRGEKLAINAGSIEQPWRVNKKGELQVFGEPTLEGVAQHYSQ